MVTDGKNLVDLFLTRFILFFIMDTLIGPNTKLTMVSCFTYRSDGLLLSLWKSCNENQTCCKPIFPYFRWKSARQQNKHNKNQVKCYKNTMAFTLTGRSQEGSHCPEGNQQIQTGFVDCGRPPGPDVAFLSRSPQHLRYFAELSLCRKRNENKSLVTLEDNHFSFLTHVVEWWMTPSPEESRWLWYTDLLEKPNNSLFTPLVEIQSQWNIWSGIRHHLRVTETAGSYTQEAEAPLCLSSLSRPQKKIFWKHSVFFGPYDGKQWASLLVGPQCSPKYLLLCSVETRPSHRFGST